MKPVSLRFQAFGPYLNEQVIDFSKLEQNGLFLICGETGAGKTTILDAMSYALYNQSSGNLRGKGLEIMRCKQASPSDDTVVDLIFDCGGRRYRFRRSLALKRKNLRDEHRCWELREGQEIPLFENPKDSNVTAKARELLGLTYEQFRQVIVLPQGQFEKLLVSDSEEKERILVSLFGAGKWDRVALEIVRRVDARADGLKQLRREIDSNLQRYGCDSPEALTLAQQNQKKTVSELQDRVLREEQTLRRMRTDWENARRINDAFDLLDRQQHTYDDLLAQKPQYDRLEAKLRQAALAQHLQPQFEAHSRAARDAETAAAAALRCRRELDSAEKELLAQQKLADAHQEAEPEDQNNRTQHALLSGSAVLYDQLPLLHAEAVRRNEALRTAAAEKDQAATDLHRAKEALAAAAAGQQASMKRYHDAQQSYLLGIGGELAQSLRAGLPCPVCGSTEHPAPARQIQNQVSKTQLDRYRSAMQASMEQTAEAERGHSQALETLEQATEMYNRAALSAAEAQKEYDLALAQRIEGIPDKLMLKKRLQFLEHAIMAYENQSRTIQSTLRNAEHQQVMAQSKLESARQSADEAAELHKQQKLLWNQALEQSGFRTEAAYLAAVMDPTQQRTGTERISRYGRDLEAAEQALREQKQALVRQTRPDLLQQEETLVQQEHSVKELQRQFTLDSDLLRRMKEDQTQLIQQQQQYERDFAAVSQDQAFARMLSGRGLSLQRYVLGVMLTSITTEANRLLRNVYGGRYQLFRTEAAGDGRRKGGLELEVLDQANGQRRSVKTLSGGEKFLVALSLAIGLAAVVQAQGSGVRMEAMFIDEGFGSLDREAVCDALDILEGIRRSSGLVGIISHVEQLAEIIPAKIEVQKGPAGSVCTIRS